MRSWLMSVFALLLLQGGTLKAQTPIVPSPPLCEDSSGTGGAIPGLASPAVGVAALQKWSSMGFWGSNAPLNGIVINFIQTSCVAQPINITASNHQPVTITVVGAIGCSGDIATQAITPVQQPDVIGTLFKFLGNAPTAIGGGVAAAVGPAATTIVLPDLANVKDTVTLSCNDATGKPTKIVKTVAVTFQNPPLVNASAGLLVSTLGKKQYGVNTTETGVTNGTVSSQYAIGVTSTSTVQLVPIAFINLFGWGSRTTSLDLQAGLGINPNGSKTRVEWLLGPAFTTHNVYLGAGVHIAQAEYLQSGYAPGQLVSSQSFTVPTDWRTTLKLGFSITYSPPVSSSSGSSK
jgi:hypothetical protein